MTKSLKVRIFFPGNKRSKLRVYRAPSGHAFNEKGVDHLLVKIADKVEKMFPDQEYSLVPIGGTAFNFVWRGARQGG